MYSKQCDETFQRELSEIKAAGLQKSERIIESPQGAHIRVAGKEVVNFCANNYLGLANHPRLIAAATSTLSSFGLGLASVRFICGTQIIHKTLEKKISDFLSTDDTILYNSCFDANGGLFETLLQDQDAIVSDELNHASIIDGIRLSKAERYRYRHLDLNSLEENLSEARTRGARRIIIATDSVFSMDGDIAPLPEICSLADQFEAMVMIDECHATGFLGEQGKGAAEMLGVLGRIDITTSTFGKALGGSAGGFSSGRGPLIEILRQKSRPYLFSNSLPPAIVGATLECIDLIRASTDLRARLHANTTRFRSAMQALGFTVQGAQHPITPIMLGDAALAARMADLLLQEGIYVIGFSYPVVPKGQARIRVQLSASHSDHDLDRAIEAFESIGRTLGVI